MMRRPLIRHTITVAVGALTAGLGVAGVAGVLTLHPHSGSHGSTAPAATPTAGGPYFVCLAYGQAWGLCIGPPTS